MHCDFLHYAKYLDSKGQFSFAFQIQGYQFGKNIPDSPNLVDIYEGENETYIEASVENSSSILYDKEIRNKPRTRRTKRNV